MVFVLIACLLVWSVGLGCLYALVILVCILCFGF